VTPSPAPVGPIAVLVAHCPVCSSSGAPEEAISAREGLGDFLRVGHLHRPAKSPTGIRGNRIDGLRRAAQWLKSSVERLYEKWSSEGISLL
jgi:hypothetical protein